MAVALAFGHNELLKPLAGDIPIETLKCCQSPLNTNFGGLLLNIVRLHKCFGNKSKFCQNAPCPKLSPCSSLNIQITEKLRALLICIPGIY